MYFSTDPLSKETVRDVFGKDIQLSLVTSHDLGGIDIHGDLFLYYEYNLSASEIEQVIRQSTFNKYPLFTSGYFSDVKLSENGMTSKWKHLPVTNPIDTLIFQATFGPMQAQERVDHKIFEDPPNYYACISARPVGNCFFILVPEDKKLYLVIRNVGG